MNLLETEKYEAPPSNDDEDNDNFVVEEETFESEASDSGKPLKSKAKQSDTAKKSRKDQMKTRKASSPKKARASSSNVGQATTQSEEATLSKSAQDDKMDVDMPITVVKSTMRTRGSKRMTKTKDAPAATSQPNNINAGVADPTTSEKVEKKLARKPTKKSKVSSPAVVESSTSPDLPPHSDQSEPKVLAPVEAPAATVANSSTSDVAPAKKTIKPPSVVVELPTSQEEVVNLLAAEIKSSGEKAAPVTGSVTRAPSVENFPPYPDQFESMDIDSPTANVENSTISDVSVSVDIDALQNFVDKDRLYELKYDSKTGVRLDTIPTNNMRYKLLYKDQLKGKGRVRVVALEFGKAMEQSGRDEFTIIDDSIDKLVEKDIEDWPPFPLDKEMDFLLAAMLHVGDPLLPWLIHNRKVEIRNAYKHHFHEETFDKVIAARGCKPYKPGSIHYVRLSWVNLLSLRKRMQQDITVKYPPRTLELIEAHFCPQKKQTRDSHGNVSKVAKDKSDSESDLIVEDEQPLSTSKSLSELSEITSEGADPTPSTSRKESESIRTGPSSDDDLSEDSVSSADSSQPGPSKKRKVTVPDKKKGKGKAVAVFGDDNDDDDDDDSSNKETEKVTPALRKTKEIIKPLDSVPSLKGGMRRVLTTAPSFRQSAGKAGSKSKYQRRERL